MIHFYQSKTSCREIISEDNFFAIAEVVTIKATRVISLKNKSCRELYNNLVKDIFHNTEDGYILSDSYDLLQEVAIVLYQNIGKTLNDIALNEDITVSKLCNRVINRSVYKARKYYDNTCPITPVTKAEYSIEDYTDLNDYSKFDEILLKLNLNERQLSVLDCYLANMRYTDILKYLNCYYPLPWNCRKQIQNKYRKIFG